MTQRYNAGPAFVHPVTHEVVPSGAWYEGAGHVGWEQPLSDLGGEEIAVSDVLTEDASTTDVLICPKCGKVYKTQKNFDAHVEKCDVQPDDGQQSTSEPPATDGQVNSDGTQPDDGQVNAGDDKVSE